MCCDSVGRCDAVLVVMLCLVCYQCDNVIMTASAGVVLVVMLCLVCYQCDNVL